MTNLEEQTRRRRSTPDRGRAAWLAAGPAAFGLGLGLASTACSSIPPGRSAIDNVAILGTNEVEESDVLEKIATTKSGKFLVWQGFLDDYEIYDRFSLRQDLARIERYYRSRGFYETHARIGRVMKNGTNHVSIYIIVEEGPPTLVRNIETKGIDDLPEPVRRAAGDAVLGILKKGKPFEEEPFAKAEAALKRALTDRGYAYAKVTRNANVNLPGRYADATFDIVPDQPAKIGKVRIEGLGNLPEAPVTRALDLKEGQPYSTQTLADAQQAVLDLAVFSSASVEPEVTDPPPADHIVPVVVRLEPAPLHNVQLGVGFEFDAIKTDLHGVAAWESKNFLGGMRNFQVRWKPGVVFFPTRLSDVVPPTALLPESRLRAVLTQPGFLEARTLGKIRLEYNVYPLLFGTKDKQEVVPGYHEGIASFGLERTLWKLLVNPSYNLQANLPFYYVGKPPINNLSFILISYLDLVTAFDFRDDKIHPRKGIFASLDSQFAGLGGTARDFRVQPELRGYVPVSRRVTVAARATMGFVFPQNYGDAYQRDLGGQSDAADYVRDLQIIFFRGFFSGGPSSNRGYALRGIGPHAYVPFLNPQVASSQIGNSCITDRSNALCQQPTGGMSLWEATLELRFPISGALTGAGFCDASNVSSQQVSLDFAKPHVSCGMGARFDTPAGPIRLDIGYRIPGLQTSPDQVQIEESYNKPIFGFFPGAVAFGIGEAF